MYLTSSNSTPSTRHVTFAGQKVSIRLETGMWEALNEICQRENTTIPKVCYTLDSQRGTSPLPFVLRTYIVSYFRDAAPQSAHHYGLSETGHRSFLFNSALAACTQ